MSQAHQQPEQRDDEQRDVASVVSHRPRDPRPRRFPEQRLVRPQRRHVEREEADPRADDSGEHASHPVAYLVERPPGVLRERPQDHAEQAEDQQQVEHRDEHRAQVAGGRLTHDGEGLTLLHREAEVEGSEQGQPEAEQESPLWATDQ